MIHFQPLMKAAGHITYFGVLFNTPKEPRTWRAEGYDYRLCVMQQERYQSKTAGAQIAFRTLAETIPHTLP